MFSLCSIWTHIHLNKSHMCPFLAKFVQGYIWTDVIYVLSWFNLYRHTHEWMSYICSVLAQFVLIYISIDDINLQSWVSLYRHACELMLYINIEDVIDYKNTQNINCKKMMYMFSLGSICTVIHLNWCHVYSAMAHEIKHVWIYMKEYMMEFF